MNHSNGLQTLFPINDLVGPRYATGIIEHLCARCEAETMFALVRKIFGLVPFEPYTLHYTIVTTIPYV